MDKRQKALDIAIENVGGLEVWETISDVVKEAFIKLQLDNLNKDQKIVEANQETVKFKEELDHYKSLDRNERYEILKDDIKRPSEEVLEIARVAMSSERIGPGFGVKQHFVAIKVDKSTEFDENNPVLYANSNLLSFRKDTVLGFKDLIVEKYNKALSYKDNIRTSNAYFMFTIWSSGKRRIGTRIIALHHDDYEDDVRLLFEAWDVLVKSIEDGRNGYEDVFGGEVCHTHLNVVIKYYPRPKCVQNWGNVKYIENFDYFNIFTANCPYTDCVVQCAERMFGYNCNIKTYEELVNHPNVCVLGVKIGVKEIKDIYDYNDFYITAESNVKQLSVINPDVKYLIHHNKHVGVLEDCKEQKRVRFYTKFRPLMKYTNCKKITVCFDIECYFDPEHNQRHVPYLCCACFLFDSNIENIMEFEGKDCVAQMLDYIADMFEVLDSDVNNVELIAHNGGGYDFHYILSSMHDPSIVNNIMIRNNNFISFDFSYRDVNFNVKDSLNFLLCSLSNAAKAFLNDNDRKTDFPHHEVRTEDDLKRIFNEWINIEQIIDTNVEKERMLITSEHIINYSNNQEYKRLIDWAREYCVNDVIVLAKVWKTFKDTIFDVFNAEVVDQTYTLASMSFRLFEANLPREITLKHPKKEDFINMRKALIGGRCISINGIYDNVLCLDVKSLYPAAMAYYEQPHGNYNKVTKEIKDKLGIYYCKIKLKKFNDHGFFPIKINNVVKYKYIEEEYETWYTSIDIKIGREEGHNITVIPFKDNYVGYSWSKKGYIFKDYIINVLYKLKNMYEEKQQMEQRWVIKIIMNSLWGKFAQKWMDDNYKIYHEDKVDFKVKEYYKIYDTEFVLGKIKDDTKQSNKPIQNGIYTLSYARYHMMKCWKAIAKENAKCIYSDTDSIFVNEKDININATFELDGRIIKVIGKNIGQLEAENTFNELICVGKKQYIGKYYKNGKVLYKKRFKGVPLKYITPDMYSHLIDNPNNYAKIKFLKFKREWGCVYGYHESKTVKQT